MQIQFDQKMTDMNDKPIPEKIPSGETNLMGQAVLVDGPTLTLRKVIINALVAEYHDEQAGPQRPGLSGEEKLNRFNLAMKVKKAADSADLTIDEVSKVKGLIAKAYSAIIVGQAWTMFEEAASKK